MNRRLTGGETERIANAYGALLGFPPGLDNSATENCRMLLQDMLTHNTTDGRPCVEPPLTDEDAQKRVLVMVRNGEMEPWLGLGTLAFCLDCTPQYIVVWPQKDWPKKGVYGCWRLARRATPEEIAAVGLEVTQ
jgi:hypothetical protein